MSFCVQRGEGVKKAEKMRLSLKYAPTNLSYYGTTPSKRVGISTNAHFGTSFIPSNTVLTESTDQTSILYISLFHYVLQVLSIANLETLYQNCLLINRH